MAQRVRRSSRERTQRASLAVPCKKSKVATTYASLIATAIERSRGKRLLLDDIYKFIDENRSILPAAAHPNWKNSVRHNLSIRPCFVKIPRKSSDGKMLSAWWTLDKSRLPVAARAAISAMERGEPLTSLGDEDFSDEPLQSDTTDDSAPSPASDAASLAAGEEEDDIDADQEEQDATDMSREQLVKDDLCDLPDLSDTMLHLPLAPTPIAQLSSAAMLMGGPLLAHHLHHHHHHMLPPMQMLMQPAAAMAAAPMHPSWEEHPSIVPELAWAMDLPTMTAFDFSAFDGAAPIVFDS